MTRPTRPDPFDPSRLYTLPNPPDVRLYSGVAYVEHTCVCLHHPQDWGLGPILLDAALFHADGRLTCPICYGPARYATAADLDRFRP